MSLTTVFTWTADSNYSISYDEKVKNFTLTLGSGSVIPAGAQIVSAVIGITKLTCWSDKREGRISIENTDVSGVYRTPSLDAKPWSKNLYTTNVYSGKSSIALKMEYVGKGDMQQDGNMLSIRSGAVVTVSVTYNTKSTGRLDASSVEAGAANTLRITPASASFTHKAVWSFGSHSQTNNVSGTSNSFTVPLAWLDAIPAALSGYAYVKLQTYSGATLLGEETYSYTVTVPASVVPTAGTLNVTGANLLNNTYYVQGLSSASASLTGSAGAYGSTIGNPVFSNTGLQNTAGVITITGTITDSRGRTASTSQPIEVYAYSAPKILGTSIFRCDASGNASDTGNYISVTVSGSVSAVPGNGMAIAVATKKSVESVYGTPIPFTNDATGILPGYESSSSYDVQVTVYDTVGKSAIYVGQVSSAGYLMYIRKDGKGAAFGKVCEHENSFELPEGWAVRVGNNTPWSNRNLLDNADFRNPVNQRGQTAYSAHGYTIDRWFIPGDSANVNVCNGYINCIATSNNYVADQYVDRNLIEDGAKYTVSILFADGVLLTATGSSAEEFFTPAYNGWLAGIQVYSTTAIFYIACRSLNVPANIAAVMLEKGTVSTLASAPAMDRFDTLQRCKQYYQRFRIGGAANSNYLGGMWLLPVEMHATTATLTLSTILTSNGAVTITQGGIFLYEGKAIKADCLVSANAGYYFEAEVILECD